MNNAQLTVIGTVVTDIDTRAVGDGRRRARFRVAATSRVLDPATGRWRDGQRTFLAVVAWRRAAEAAGQLRRGARVIVVGQLRQYDYAREGQRELGYELQAQEIGLCLPARTAELAPADEQPAGAAKTG
jgi:single-strand DNA-binding protein